MIVDGGRRNEADIPPLLARLPFPEDWSIVVVRPPGESGLHGPDESRAFADLPRFTQDVTDSLCRLVLLEILPAVLERDLAAFGAALGELQARVGACFAPAQGGDLLDGAGAANRRRCCGAPGSSASARARGARLSMRFSSLSARELESTVAALRQRFGLDRTAVFVTRAANQGARFRRR